MEHEAKVNPAQAPKRLVSALLVYWLFAGIAGAITVSSTGGNSSEVIVLFAVGMLAVPLAVLLGLKTARYRSWKPAVQTIAVLSAAGMFAWLLADGATWPGFAIVCGCFPAAVFAGVWLGPDRPNQ